MDWLYQNCVLHWQFSTKVYDLSENITEVINKLENKKTCPESYTKKSSFIISPSYDLHKDNFTIWFIAMIKLCIQKNHFCTSKPTSLLEEDVQRNLIFWVFVGFYYFRQNKVYQIWKEKLKYWDAEWCER